MAETIAPQEEPKPKYVIEYQATDDEGNPIGRPTHLEAETPEEMFEKQKAAHIAASRALARQNKAFNDLKQRKLERVSTPSAAPVPQLSPEEQKQREQLRRIGGIEEIEDRLQKAEAKAKEADGKAVAYSFMRNHMYDYFPCEANSKVLWDFLVAEQLEYTLDNLEIAFAACKDQLAQDPRQAVQNNPPIAENQTAPSSEQNRRQPTLGMQPNIGSNPRPQQSVGSNRGGKMTKKDVLAKKKADPAWWKQVLKDPNLQKEVNEALARG